MYQAWFDVTHRGALGAAGAFLITFLLIPALMRAAWKVGLVDRPGGRKMHAAPTPVVGGLAIAIGFIPLALAIFRPSQPLLGLGAAAAILLPAGIIDDLFNLKWWWRILAQAAAALVMIEVGGVKVELIGSALGLAHHTLGVLSIPFTVIATVGLINALNMVDGVDGLAGGLTLAALTMLAAAAIYAGAGGLASGLVMVIGAGLAFLAFNLRTPFEPRARIFLGNAGSEFLGLLIAWTCFRLTQNPAHPVNPVLAPFLIAPPLIDCLVLIVQRARQGRSPFSADRNHLHHLLLDAGLTPTGVVAVIVGASMSLGLAAALAMRAHAPQPLFVVAFLALVAGHFLLTRRRDQAIVLFGHLAPRRPAGRRAAVPVVHAPLSAGGRH